MKHALNGLAISAFGAVLALALAGCSDRNADSETPQADITTSATQQATADSSPAPTRTNAPAAASPEGEMAVADLVEFAEPAIVRIETGGGVGTGFIVSEDGYIVTNNHVVADRNGAPSVTVNVTLSDGTRLSGDVTGTDPRSDLAVVKISGGPYESLPLGDLDRVKIGQDVVAIGYALDLGRGEGASFSVTRGIVSQKNRAISENASILGAIQTDAAINHGNSGGPLLSLSGEVLGVNTALAPDPSSPSGVAQGIGFAVGVDTVRAVWEQLRDSGFVNRGLLGIQNFEALRPATARDMGIPEDQGGVYLSSPDSVDPASAAALGGLQTGDVITRIGDEEIENESDLAVAMIKYGPGESVDLTFYRGSEEFTVPVTLGSP